MKRVRCILKKQERQGAGPDMSGAGAGAGSTGADDVVDGDYREV